MSMLTLTAAQVVVITEALADAEAYRRDLSAGLCVLCTASQDGACQGHLKDLGRAAAYRDVATEIVHVLTKEIRPTAVREHHGRPRNHSR